VTTHERAPATAPGPPDLSPLLLETRRLLGSEAGDVPCGVSVADWLRISRVAEATGDSNPLYLDPQYGVRTWWRTMVAPPAFVLAIRVPESAGALHARPYDAVDLLCHIELWWDDHIHLGDRVGAGVRVLRAERGPPWRGRETVDITSRCVFRSGGREVASATGTVRVHPLRLGQELFVDRDLHRYGPAEVADLVRRLEAEPGPRGARPRFADDVSVGEALPDVVRGPFTWSDLITWIIAEGRPALAGNLRHWELAAQPGRAIANAATGWPVSDRRHAREDLQACTGVGFRSPCARPALLVALATQVVTTWMGDDGFLRHLAASLEAPVLYGDVLSFAGRVTDKLTQKSEGKVYSGVWLEVQAHNQLGEHVITARALVFLPQPGQPVEVPVSGAAP
jgi:acyl dehydratase